MTISEGTVRDAVEQRLLRLGFDVEPLPLDALHATFARRTTPCTGVHYALTVLGVPTAFSAWIAAQEQLELLDAARRQDREEGRAILVHELVLPDAYVVFELTAPPSTDRTGALVPHLKALADAFPDVELQDKLVAPPTAGGAA